jgi:mono/diheme cytochrome c family protein
MTAGSIILVDPSKGVDGLKPITRLTPDAPFPESETTVPGAWHAVMPGTEPYDTPENRRTPGHCYRSPYPLSERLFLAAYSFRGLVGEPRGNPANMFGIYLCDADGNKELLYRDPNIASVWPVPLRPRRRPPVLPPAPGPRVADTGVFVLQDVYASLPRLRKSSVKALRIVQVLPKSTPGKDLPPIGIPSGAPGKQVLGTVPVEPDGSAHFVAPARKELAFQALDERGLAVQVMRSGTYLQPGEHATCVGCHEPRASSPPGARPLALRRQASRIRPGPDGSRPFSYPVLVQPILDRKCVACHSGPKAGGGIVLTGEPDGPYTRSYNALAPRVAFSDMSNGEAISKPGRFGAHGSPLMKMLERGHQGVRLTRTEVERLATWMDVSALFYGTFDRAEQERQRRGERIACPKLE